MSSNNKYIPDWREDAPAADSYRSIFNYDANQCKHPSAAWVEMFKQEFGMTDEDFKQRQPGGDEKVKCDHKINLSSTHW